jgi:hypothetical protein
VQYRVGIDIGGTFTDIVLAGEDGTRASCKVLTTPDDFGRAIAEGLAQLMQRHKLAPGQIARIVHATTVATNAILEGKGAATGLITTEGFRDVLEMRRLRIPEMYTLGYRTPPPLVPRRLRLEVAERMGPRGELRRRSTRRAPRRPRSGSPPRASTPSLSRCCMPTPTPRMKAASPRSWRARCRTRSSPARRRSCPRSANTSEPARRSSTPISALSCAATSPR